MIKPFKLLFVIPQNNKPMKRIILILFTVAIASVNTLAQEPTKTKPAPKTPEERAENMTKRLTKELNLSIDQQDKVKSIILKRELDREKIKKEMKEGPSKVKQELKVVLSPEQFQKFEAKEAEMKQKREERRKKALEKKAAEQPSKEVK